MSGLRRLVGLWPALLTVVLLLLIWESYVRLAGIRPTVLPAPSRVAEQIWLNLPALADHAVPTLTATLLGFALSITAAFGFSVLIDFSPLARRALLPVFVISQTLPLIAIAPLVVLWFGFGLGPKILLVAFLTFFPMLVALVQGYAATDRDIEALLQSMGASPGRIFRLARLPSAVPYFFAGLRIAIAHAVVAAIFAEYVGAQKGLGIYMLTAKNNFRPDLVLAVVAVSAVMTLALFGLVHLVERLATPWARVSQRGDP